MGEELPAGGLEDEDGHYFGDLGGLSVDLFRGRW